MLAARVNENSDKSGLPRPPPPLPWHRSATAHFARPQVLFICHQVPQWYPQCLHPHPCKALTSQDAEAAC